MQELSWWPLFGCSLPSTALLALVQGARSTFYMRRFCFVKRCDGIRAVGRSVGKSQAVVPAVEAAAVTRPAALREARGASELVVASRVRAHPPAIEQAKAK